MENLKSAAELGTYAVALIVALLSFLRWGVPFCRRFHLAMCAASDVSREFGPEAGRAIRHLYFKLQEDVGRLAVKSALNERELNLAIYICDVKGEWTFSNEVLCELFGLTQEQMTGKGWLRAIRESRSTYEHWKFSVENRTPYRAEYTIEHQSDSDIPPRLARTEAFPVMTVDGKEILCYVGVVRLHHPQVHSPIKPPIFT